MVFWFRLSSCSRATFSSYFPFSLTLCPRFPLVLYLPFTSSPPSPLHLFVSVFFPVWYVTIEARLRALSHASAVQPAGEVSLLAFAPESAGERQRAPAFDLSATSSAALSLHILSTSLSRRPPSPFAPLQSFIFLPRCPSPLDPTFLHLSLPVAPAMTSSSPPPARRPAHSPPPLPPPLSWRCLHLHRRLSAGVGG